MCMGEETDKWVREGSREGRKTDRLRGEGGAGENGAFGLEVSIFFIAICMLRFFIAICIL